MSTCAVFSESIPHLLRSHYNHLRACDLSDDVMGAHAGFEPAISVLRGQRPAYQLVPLATN